MSVPRALRSLAAAVVAVATLTLSYPGGVQAVETVEFMPSGVNWAGIDSPLFVPSIVLVPGDQTSDNFRVKNLSGEVAFVVLFDAGTTVAGPPLPDDSQPRFSVRTDSASVDSLSLSTLRRCEPLIVESVPAQGEVEITVTVGLPWSSDNSNQGITISPKLSVGMGGGDAPSNFNPCTHDPSASAVPATPAPPITSAVGGSGVVAVTPVRPASATGFNLDPRVPWLAGCLVAGGMFLVGLSRRRGRSSAGPGDGVGELVSIPHGVESVDDDS